MDHQADALLTVRDVCAYLRITPSTLYKLFRDHELKSIKVGGSRRITWSELEGYIKRKTSVPEEQVFETEYQEEVQ